MKGVGQSQRNAIAICEMSKTSGHYGKRHTKEDLENHSRDQQYLLEQWLNIIRLHRKIRREFITLARKYYQESFMALIGSREGFWKGDSVSRPGRIG